jgi:tyrosyl-tRNA synthetase
MSQIKDIDKQVEQLLKGVSDIISKKELVAKLKLASKEKRPLRVKLGVDASASDIHLGTAVPLNKLRQFQDLGHEAIFLIGDFTGMIGDPSGRSKTRKPLTQEQVDINARVLKKQIFKILDPKKTEVVYNSSWCNKMTFSDVIKLASHYTVAQLLERDDFEKRYKANQAIGLHEFLYPLVQGYDSVVLKSDIEICGTDQRFNCLVGRAFQEAYGQRPQVIIMMPILEGMGTKEKMSKSLGNYIGITETAESMYAKLMSITDEQVYDYYILCTKLSEKEIKDKIKAFKNKPKELKEELAFEITSLYHNKDSAENAKDIFDIKHGKKLRSQKMSEKETIIVLKKIAKKVELNRSNFKENKIWICTLMKEIAAVESTSEARRAISQGALKINNQVIKDVSYEVPKNEQEFILQIGKRRIFNIKIM